MTTKTKPGKAPVKPSAAPPPAPRRKKVVAPAALAEAEAIKVQLPEEAPSVPPEEVAPAAAPGPTPASSRYAQDRSAVARELDLKDFSRRLYEIMQREEMSASALAKRIFGETTDEQGYVVAKGRDRVSHWLNGKQLPGPKNLGMIAEQLGCKPQDLMPSRFEPSAESPGDFRMETISGHPGKMFIELRMTVDTAVAFKIAALLEGSK